MHNLCIIRDYQVHFRIDAKHRQDAPKANFEGLYFSRMVREVMDEYAVRQPVTLKLKLGVSAVRRKRAATDGRDGVKAMDRPVTKVVAEQPAISSRASLRQSPVEVPTRKDKVAETARPAKRAPKEPSDLLRTLSRNVRVARADAGLTQRQLAALAELPQEMICDIERAQRNVTVKTVTELARALSVTELDLLTPIVWSEPEH